MLEKFTGLRFHYMVHLLNASLTCVPDMKITGLTPATVACLTGLHQAITKSSSTASTLICFDVLLASHEWGKQWASHLQHAADVDSIVKSINDYMATRKSGTGSGRTPEEKTTSQTSLVRANFRDVSSQLQVLFL